MNRCVKYFITKNKLSKECSNVGWKSASEDMITKVSEVFSSVLRGTDEWREIIKVIFQGVEMTAKQSSKRKITDNVPLADVIPQLHPVELPTGRHMLSHQLHHLMSHYIECVTE